MVLADSVLTKPIDPLSGVLLMIAVSALCVWLAPRGARLLVRRIPKENRAAALAHDGPLKRFYAAARWARWVLAGVVVVVLIRLVL